MVFKSKNSHFRKIEKGTQAGMVNLDTQTTAKNIPGYYFKQLSPA